MSASVAKTPKKKKPASPGGKKKSGKSGGKGDSGGKAAAEEERKRLQAELGVAAAGRAAQEAAARALEAQLAALRQRASAEAATAADVLASQQRQQLAAQEASRVLEQQLAEARNDAMALRTALEAAQAAAAQAAEAAAGNAGPEQESSELLRLLSNSRRQEERLEAAAGTLETLRLRLQAVERDLVAERDMVATMQARSVRVQGRSELRFIRGAPFLVRIARERLGGTLPPLALHPGGSLAAAGRQQLVAVQPASLHVLDLAAHRWWASATAGCQNRSSSSSSSSIKATTAQQTAAGSPARATTASPSYTAVKGRAVCGIGSKLLGFGGECEGRLLPAGACTQFLHPDLQAWLPAPPPAEAGAPQPAPRTAAALAYCPRLRAAFMYGGEGEGGALLGDLWRLDLSTMAWTRVDKLATCRPRTPNTHDTPPPAAGAALAVAPDGSRLWLMGGRLEGGRCSNALHWFDLNVHYWAAVEPQTWAIDSRSHHVMACLDRYLLVAGGLCHTASGQAIHRQDCCIYDPAASAWDVLTDTAFEPVPAGSEKRVVVSVATNAQVDCSCCSRRTTSGSGSGGSGKGSRLASAQPSFNATGSPPFLGAGTCAFAEGRLLLLKAPKGGAAGGEEAAPGPVSELWTVELQLPSSIEREQQRAVQRTTTVKELTLREELVAPTSVRLSWQAPTAGADKLVSFKLMATNAEGRAREAYEGRETGCDVTGLAPSSQYVFCVKALFDDATFLWSEPIMVTTKKAATGEGAGGAPSGSASGGLQAK
ncbi:hypothetical protein ABPG75_012985 [Micractinium tetrahymenae]